MQRGRARGASESFSTHDNTDQKPFGIDSTDMGLFALVPTLRNRGIRSKSPPLNFDPDLGRAENQSQS